jgi:hypothetical protein
MNKQIIFSIMLVIAAMSAYAQCGSCIIDQACMATKPKGVCDSILPDATKGVSYQKDVSFFMKPTVNDAATLSQCQCNYVQLDTIKFGAVSGLPPGLTFEYSKPGKKYYPSSGDSVGCIRFCGTPILPGDYVVKMNFLADVVVKGIAVIGDLIVRDQQQSYTLYIKVLPSLTPVITSFTYGSNGYTTCDTAITLDFNATLAAQAPNLTSYSWNFDDGTGSAQKNPGLKTYNVADTFSVSLTTRYYNYRIKTVYTDIKDGYVGDIEEATTVQSPDPYIKFNTLGFANRGGKTDVKKTSWNNLNIVIPEGTDSVDIQIWDEDTGPPDGTNPFGSPDDNLGVFRVAVRLDTARFSNGNVSGLITFDTVVSNVFKDTLPVVIYPAVIIPGIAASADSICLGDTITLSIGNGYSNYSTQWYNDTIAIVGGNSPVYYANHTGNYAAKVVNLTTGCSAKSAIERYVFMKSPPDSLEIVVLPDGSLVNNNYPGQAFSVQWYKNGVVMPGETNFIMFPTGIGYYSCKVYNPAFPSCTSTSALFLFTAVSEIPVATWSVYPNPVSNKLNIEAVMGGQSHLQLLNMEGRIVTEKIFEIKEMLDIESLAKGIYILKLSNSNAAAAKRIIVE